ncbi:MAG TPA: hypothetical protein VFV66_16740 [Nonomuraea sp.]|nr:hypothetical protein [Nonomuraea sp.]
MPVPPDHLRVRIEDMVDHHGTQRWPRLEEVIFRWRGSFGYLIAVLDTYMKGLDQTLPDRIPRRR